MLWLLLMFLFLHSIEGQNKQEAINLIVGGNEVGIEAYPFILHLNVNEITEIGHCGASLISESWALTAAHCVETVHAPNLITVRAGTNNRCDQSGHEVKVKNVHLHPKFVQVDANDIALLELDKPFKLNDKIKPVALPDANFDLPEKYVLTIIGFGAKCEGGRSTCELRTAEVFVRNLDSCAKSYKKNLQTQFCACAPGVDTCQGDSGGPIYDKINKVQVGITSFGYGCAREDYPGVYTDLRKERSWISEVTGI